METPDLAAAYSHTIAHRLRQVDGWTWALAAAGLFVLAVLLARALATDGGGELESQDELDEDMMRGFLGRRKKNKKGAK